MATYPISSRSTSQMPLAAAASISAGHSRGRTLAATRAQPSPSRARAPVAPAVEATKATPRTTVSPASARTARSGRAMGSRYRQAPATRVGRPDDPPTPEVVRGDPAAPPRIRPVGGADVVFLVVAGVLAGVARSVAGLASLVSYPALLAVGLPALTAHVTNTVALVLYTVGAASFSRQELAGQGSRLRRPGAIPGGRG